MAKMFYTLSEVCEKLGTLPRRDVAIQRLMCHDGRPTGTSFELRGIPFVPLDRRLEQRADFLSAHAPPEPRSRMDGRLRLRVLFEFLGGRKDAVVRE